MPFAPQLLSCEVDLDLGAIVFTANFDGVQGSGILPLTDLVEAAGEGFLDLNLYRVTEEGSQTSGAT